MQAEEGESEAGQLESCHLDLERGLRGFYKDEKAAELVEEEFVQEGEN